MTGPGYRDLPGMAAVAVVAVLICAPLLALGLDLAAATKPMDLEHILPGSRAGLLLLNSLLFSSGAILLGLLLAIPAASILMDISGRGGHLLRILAVAPIAVPPYLHAMAWQRLSEAAGVSASGIGVAFWVETSARLPLLMAAVLIGLHVADAGSRDAARIYVSRMRTLVFITLPQARPAMVAGACIAMVFSLNEYGLPALFQRHTYALEIFTEYSVSGNSVDTMLVALPLVLLSVLFAATAIDRLCALPTPVVDSRPETVALAGPWFYDTVRLGALGAVFSPLLLLLWSSGILIAGGSTTSGLGAGFSSMADSVVVAIGATCIALPCAWVLAERLHRYGSRLLWTLVLLGLALPASLSGAGSIRFWSWSGLEYLYTGRGLQLAGMLVGLIPLATLLLYAVIRNSDRLPWEAARLYRHGVTLWIRIRLFQLWPGFVGASLLLFAISLPELQLSLLLSPPGSTGVGVRIFNYLHYGAQEQVAYLVMVLLVSSLAMGGITHRLLAHQTRMGTMESMGGYRQ
jgi:iron(III) transport system permease protein